ncbi:MAG: hypothetical protein GWM88_06020, partial [Pseudomonadales bacterium]|nr:hypothetical protein [Pseudomonadales bacterium]NIX07582.1 hypothetical protein [Pseudomonadales bacterium]
APVPVLDGALAWSFADDGKLFYSQTGLGSSVTLQLTWVDRTGQTSAVDADWTFDRGSDVNQGWSVSP